MNPFPQRARISPTRLRLGVSAGLLASFAVSGAGRASAPCPPTAVVEGATEMVSPIAAVLRRRGVRSQPSACGRMVRASLSARPGGRTYSLHIEDGYGRVSEREIADAATAASLIESWATDEDADVLAPHTAGVGVESVTAEPSPPLAGASPSWRATILGEVASASDGTAWYGGALAACGSVGPLCVGGRTEIARDGGGDSSLTGTFSRVRIGAGALAALPVSLGAFTLIPRVGFGLHSTRSVLSAAPIELSAVDLSLGAEAGLEVTHAISGHLSLAAAVGGLYAYPTSTRSNIVTSAFLVVPPRGFLHLGVGLQYAR